MRNSFIFKKNPLQLAIFSCLLGSISTHAIETDDSEKEKEMEKITVTARFKSESIIEIPMAISSISAMDIQDRNYTNAEDIYRTLAGAALPGDELILRGLSGGNTSAPETTTTFVDDIPLDFTNLSDVERVEVLRGPQGTLYGSNAIGGTVRIITNKPVLDQFELFGSVQAGGEKNVDGYDSNISFGVNIPLLEDTLALRINTNFEDNQLPFVNMNTGLQSSEENSFIRSQLLWKLTDDLAITFGYSNIKSKQFGEKFGDLSTPGFYYDYSLTENGASPYGYDVTDFEVACDPNATRAVCKGGSSPIAMNGVPEKYQVWESIDNWIHENTDIFTLNIQDNNFFDFATLTYAGSFRKYDYEDIDNWSRLDASDLFKTWIVNDDRYERTTHELRFQNLDLTSPIAWTVGMFYDRKEAKNISGSQRQYMESGDINSALALYWLGDDATQIGIDTFNDPQQIWGFDLITDITREFSLFADVSYTFDLGDMGNLELNAGIRRFDLEDTYHYRTAGIWGADESKESGKEDGNRYKFSASYRPSDDLSVYALYSEGYRPGGNNGPLPNLCINDPKAGENKDRYTSDTIDNYELGLKASALDGALDFTVAAYHIDWTDIKTEIYMGTCGFTYITNAGEAQSQGIEFESTLQLENDLTINFNTSYTKSELTEDNEAIEGEKGDDMTMVPDWNVYLAFDQGFELLGKQAFIRADYNYYGEYKTHFNTRPEDEVPSYSYVNLSGRIEISDQATVSVHLNNVFDKEAIKFKNARSRDVGNTTSQQYIEFLGERNLTVRLDYSFL